VAYKVTLIVDKRPRSLRLIAFLAVANKWLHRGLGVKLDMEFEEITDEAGS
jgi:hypothetical protein